MSRLEAENLVSRCFSNCDLKRPDDGIDRREVAAPLSEAHPILRNGRSSGRARPIFTDRGFDNAPPEIKVILEIENPGCYLSDANIS